MNRAFLQRVLEGDHEAQALFGEAENCAVIDWRDGAAEVVTAIAAFLPKGQLTPMDGDSYSVFVAPRSMWSNIESAHRQATERLFLNTQRLAAYLSKGYLARLFSKP